MVHHYVQLGWRPSEVYNATEGEKAFLFASMLVQMEKESKKEGICPFFGKK